jgi:hypothetical protein
MVSGSVREEEEEILKVGKNERLFTFVFVTLLKINTTILHVLDNKLY